MLYGVRSHSWVYIRQKVAPENLDRDLPIALRRCFPYMNADISHFETLLQIKLVSFKFFAFSLLVVENARLEAKMRRKRPQEAPGRAKSKSIIPR